MILIRTEHREKRAGIHSVETTYPKAKKIITKETIRIRFSITRQFLLMLIYNNYQRLKYIIKNNR